MKREPKVCTKCGKPLPKEHYRARVENGHVVPILEHVICPRGAEPSG